MRNPIERIFAYGTEGLDAAQARQVNVVTMVALIAILAIPSDIAIFWLFGFPIFFLPNIFAAAFTVLYGVPLILVGLRRHLAAKIVLALMLNADMFIYAFFYSADAGVHLFMPAFGLLAFLMFDSSQKVLMGFFVALPAVLFLFVIYHFTAPYEAIHLDHGVIRILQITNSMIMFVVICFVVFIFFARVERAETRLLRFSDAVSEYLDSGLVEKLRDGEDVRPRLRDLTVLFADLAGSTALSFVMEKENYGRMINAYVREMEAIIKAAGAYIEDISGDGILAYIGNFNSSGAKEDALTAVETAVAMQRKLRELVPSFRAAYGLPDELFMRVGIAAGPAMVGKTEGVRAIYTANGEAVNLAAKLEAKVKEISADGGILIAESVQDLIGDRFAAARRTLDVEGQTITAYSVEY